MNKLVIYSTLFVKTLVVVAMLSGCTGLQTFSNSARSGETISIMYNIANSNSRNSNRDNTIIVIEDSMGMITKYYPGDPNVKAILNLYPDPASYTVVGYQTQQNFRSNELQIGGTNANTGSGGYSDWYQTVAYFNLPLNMAPGEARITAIVDSESKSSTVEIIGGVGTPQSFEGSPLTSTASPLERFQSFERSPFRSVVIRGPDHATANLVQAIDIKFAHDPDVDNGGQGRAYVSNPRGDITSINWSDNGTLLHAIVTPANKVFPNTSYNLKFYVTGGITGLAVDSLTAVDTNGYPVAGIYAVVSPLIHSVTQNTQTNSLEIYGDNLCLECVSTEETHVFLRVNDTWSVLTPTSISPTLITVDMPAITAEDNASVTTWIVGAGRSSKKFQVQ